MTSRFAADERLLKPSMCGTETIAASEEQR